MMVFKQLKRQIVSSSSMVKMGILSVFLMEVALWLVGRLYPIDSEIYFSLLSPVAITAGSLPLLCIFLFIYLKRPPLLEQVRQSKQAEFKLGMLFVFLSSVVLSLIPSMLFILMAVFSNNSDFIKASIVAEVVLRHFMFLFIVGIIQYLGVLLVENKAIVPGFMLGSLISLSFMTDYKFVRNLFIFTQPPIQNKGDGRPLSFVIPLFLCVALCLIYVAYETIVRKEALGGTYD